MRGTRINVGQTLRVPSARSSRSTSRNTTARQAVPASGRYEVRSGDTLGGIAERFGVTASDLRRWNNMRGSRIIAGNTLIVKSGAPPAAARSVAPKRSSSASTSGTPVRYRIRSGDKLALIAQRNDTSVADLKNWNSLTSSRIRAGNTLIVGYGKGSSSNAAPTRKIRASAPASGSTYVVRSGDTLGAIAEVYGTTASNLRAWNGIRGSRISIGQKLTVRAPGSASNATSGSAQYKIRGGDTLEIIARRFSVTIAQLKAWNNLQSSRIKAGDLLTVRTTSSANRGG
jgi:LysM repeat protein